MHVFLETFLLLHLFGHLVDDCSKVLRFDMFVLIGPFQLPLDLADLILQPMFVSLSI